METKVQEQKKEVASKFGEGRCKICGKPTYKNEIGSTCTKHLGKVGLFYKPVVKDPKEDPAFVSVKQLCDRAEELGKSRGFAVALTGKDAGTEPPFSPIFQVFVFGKRKYVKKEALKELEKQIK